MMECTMNPESPRRIEMIDIFIFMLSEAKRIREIRSDF